jgi:tyramine---L-glutamate ligase
MRGLIVEHISAGGCAIDGDTAPVSDHLVQQGWAMLEAILKDAARAGVRVSTLVRQAPKNKIEGCDFIVVDDEVALLDRFDSLARQADWVLVIAPETDDALTRWLTRIEVLGVRTMNCSVPATALCGDKLSLGLHLTQAGVKTPQVVRFMDGDDVDADLWCKQFARIVVKPRYGAGCEQAFCFNGGEVGTQRERFESCFNSVHGGTEMIVQPCVDGDAFSASYFVNEGDVTLLGVCRQHIDFVNEGASCVRLVYRGGEVVSDAALARRVDRLGKQAVDSIVGLGGFVGVDVVLASSCDAAGAVCDVEDFVIEINPRLTMSYVGLRAVGDSNLAAGLMGSVEATRSAQQRLGKLDGTRNKDGRTGFVQFNTAGVIDDD